MVIGLVAIIMAKWGYLHSSELLRHLRTAPSQAAVESKQPCETSSYPSLQQQYKTSQQEERCIQIEEIMSGPSDLERTWE